MPSTALPIRRPRAPVSALLLVVALHLGLGLALLKMPVWRDRSATVSAHSPLLLRLLPWERPRPMPMTLPRPAAPNHAVAPARAAQPQAITAPAAMMPQAPVPSTSGIAAPAPRASGPAPAPAQPPLNLALPRGASAPWRQQPRNPALEDARANSAPATIESRLAAVLDGTWHVERLDYNRVRARRGGECVVIERTRAGQLEVANGAFRELWAAKGC